MNVNGIRAGDVGTDYRTIIPRKAEVSIDMRLVPQQTHGAILQLVSDFIEDWGAVRGISDAISIDKLNSMDPAPSSFDTEAFELVTQGTSF